MENGHNVKEPAIQPSFLLIKAFLLSPTASWSLFSFYLCVKAFISVAAGFELTTALHSFSSGPAVGPIKAVG